VAVCGHFFLAVFFHIMHNGVSKRETTHSLACCWNQLLGWHLYMNIHVYIISICFDSKLLFYKLSSNLTNFSVFIFINL